MGKRLLFKDTRKRDFACVSLYTIMLVNELSPCDSGGSIEMHPSLSQSGHYYNARGTPFSYSNLHFANTDSPFKVKYLRMYSCTSRHA